MTTIAIPQRAIARCGTANFGSVAVICSIPLNHNRSTIMVSLSVAIAVTPDNNRLVAVATIAVTAIFTVAVAVPIMARAHGDARRTYSDPDFFRAGR
jgi:hypothetical protein